MNRIPVLLLAAASSLITLPALSAPKMPPERPDMIKLMDSNQDSQVSEAEFITFTTAENKKQFAGLDLNKDGQITRAELDEREQMMRKQWEEMRKQHESMQPPAPPAGAAPPAPPAPPAGATPPAPPAP